MRLQLELLIRQGSSEHWNPEGQRISQDHFEALHLCSRSVKKNWAFARGFSHTTEQKYRVPECEPVDGKIVEGSIVRASVAKRITTQIQSNQKKDD
jgi:hypothetical protein